MYRGCQFWRPLFLLALVFVATSFDALRALDEVTARDHALRLHERLTGVPPSSTELTLLTQLLRDGKVAEATFRVMNNNYFYKELARSFSAFADIDQQPNDTLTDFSAAVVGLTISNRRFDELFYGDILYTAPDALMTYQFGTPPVNVNHDSSPLIRVNGGAAPAGFVRPPFRCNTTGCTNATVNPDVIYDDQAHFSDLQNRFPDWPQRLVLRSQYSSYQLLRNEQKVPASSIAGVWTLQEAAREVFNAGTNRRILRLFLRLLGYELEQVHDATRPDLYVRRDVDRQPGGSVSAFQQGCRGCHAGMDGLVQAFVYFDFTGRLRYGPTFTQNAPNDFKIYRQHNIYPQGHLAVNDQWVNLWTQGPNASRIGWRTPKAITSDVTQGSGAASLAASFAGTEAFSNNLAKVVFQRICLRAPTTLEKGTLNNKARAFEEGISDYESFSANGPYNMRALHASVAEMCIGKVMP